MAYRNQPGLSIGIGTDQELIWTRGFGYADVTQEVAATAKTIYRIASITKLFTATAILQLRDAGKLQLDDPVTKHLPWFAIQDTYPAAPPITIRHLLTHTAGLPREADFPYWTDSEFPTVEEIQATISNQSTILPTETRWKYSNLALSLAGEIVATVSGQEYSDYIRQQILNPLGMNDTHVHAIDPEHPQLATGYGRRLPDGIRQHSPYTDCRGITPAANMASTVEDLARFAMWQLQDETADTAILHSNTRREMQRIHWLQDDWQAGWGLGFYIWRRQGKTYIGHGGALQGYRTEVQLCPKEKLFAVVLTNADDGMPLMYMEKIFDWVFPAIAKAVAPLPEPPQAELIWQQYVGKYRNAWGDVQILIFKDELLMIDPSQPDPMVAPTKLVPMGEHAFRMESEVGFMNHGEWALFELDDQGQVVRVKSGANFLYPIEQW